MQMLTPQQIEQTSLLVNNMSVAQKVWVSGYLQGMALQADNSLESLALTLPEMTAGSDVVEQKITVLFGSQTGNSQKIAEALQVALESQGRVVKLQNMLNYRNSQLKKEEHLFVIVSTHGNGEPPDEALGFFKYINSTKAPKLNGVKFSILALGDSSYDEFCQTGYELDARLAELGASRFSDLVACDVDYADDAQDWQSNLLTLLKPSIDQSVGIELDDLPLTITNEISNHNEQNPFQAEVLETVVLTDDGSDKTVHHLELSLEGSGISYAPGDIVCIKATNSESLVDSILNEAALDGATEVLLKKSTLPLKKALLDNRELSNITRKQLQTYAELINDDELLTLAGDIEQLQQELEAADVLDVLQLWPPKTDSFDAQQLIDWLRPLNARQYSIASSESASSEELHVLVKQVEYEFRGRLHSGLCSTQLAQVQAGDYLGISIKANPAFKLPENPDSKLIMIGAGTGVAPFRSFLYERESLGVAGNSWLLFGEQHFQTDFLYQSEWQQFLKDGVLEKMDVAFSRDQQERIYVQHRLLEQAEAVYQWLESGAYIYVCGDMNRMARDVHQALIDIVEQQSDRTREQAIDWLDQLISDKRYQRDIY